MRGSAGLVQKSAATSIRANASPSAAPSTAPSMCVTDRSRIRHSKATTSAPSSRPKPALKTTGASSGRRKIAAPVTAARKSTRARRNQAIG